MHNLRNLATKRVYQMSNSNRFQENERLELLVKITETGWWEADLRNETYIYSNFLSDKLELSPDGCSFATFNQLIREDYRPRVISDLRTVKEGEIRKLDFPVKTSIGTIWLQARFMVKETDENGASIIAGSLQVRENLEENNEREAMLNKFHNLLHQQDNISKSLLSFLKNKDITEVVNQALNNLLVQFNADRSFVMEYDKKAQVQNCIYEAASEDRFRVISLYQGIPLKEDDWWDSQTLDQKPIIVSDMKTDGNSRPPYEDFLTVMNIKSVMIVPLVSRNNEVWGYAGVDVIKEPRTWSDEDYHWFSSMVNVINICLQLRKSEDKIKQDDQLLRNVYENLPIGLEIFDEEGILIAANDKDVEILGMTNKDDYMGVNIFDHPILPLEVKKRMKQGESIDFHSSYEFGRIDDGFYSKRPTKKGSTNMTTKIVPVLSEEGGIQNYLFINIDNTETTNAYLRIQEFEEYFSLIADFAQVGYFKWNLIKKEGFAISQWFKNLNKPVDTLISENVKEMYENVHPDDCAGLEAFYTKALTGEVQNLQHEVRVENPDGTFKWLRCTLMVKEYDPEHDNIEMIGISIDITELKKMILAKDKAETLDKLKTAFLANMSHEIRTPLNAIVGFSDLLTEINDPEERKEYIKIIRHNNDLLLKLVSDILDLSKIESDTFESVRNNIEIKDVCRGIAITMRMKETPQVKLLFDEELPEMTIHGDLDRITQVITNLINNAMKFTLKGEVRFGYQQADENTILFYVDDTGIGIPEEEYERIFDRFVKLDMFSQGTGLGLSVSRSIVMQLGGEMKVKSEVGKGSRFWFTLPIH